jgi:1-acyl-sn-glycerol-3-phosphate acyltransferase
MTAILSTILVALSFALLAPMAILLALITGSGDPAHNVGRLWGKFVLWGSRVKVEVTGQEHIPSGVPVVFASNHTSQFDIPILYQTLPVQFRFLVKKELFKIPLFGAAMRRTGYIPIDRTRGKAALQSLREAANRIREGTSVVVFPEGTRSPDGRLSSFKVGGMMLAIKAQCPVMPVAISGSHKILPKGSLRIRPGRVHVSVGRPVPTVDADGPRSKNEVTTEVWGTIASMLEGDNRPT